MDGADQHRLMVVGGARILCAIGFLCPSPDVRRSTRAVGEINLNWQNTVHCFGCVAGPDVLPASTGCCLLCPRAQGAEGCCRGHGARQHEPLRKASADQADQGEQQGRGQPLRAARGWRHCVRRERPLPVPQATRCQAGAPWCNFTVIYNAIAIYRVCCGRTSAQTLGARVVFLQSQTPVR